ncbi:MAG: Gfo/Idh/MocA family oxidoreductase [Terrisporobacter sp.]|uniref:Gfo/Idh/MocA family protein n=1 Tax=Terrisporobacter sp. TaxID=1965305 RepID=UPI002FC90E2E
MGKIKLAIIGAGLRGMYTYGSFIEENKDLCEVVAIVEGKKGRRDLFQKKFNLPEDKAFENIESFFEEDKIADGVIICNYDSLHFTTASFALEKGYDILLEGPVSNNLDEIVHLDALCNKYEDKIMMSAMPYRYSNIFNKIKEIIDEKYLGTLVNINYNSHIGYEKFVHNYVRGNWRIDSDSATLMLTNSSYDLDMLLYLAGSNCEKISSFGKLNHFKRENFKGDMSEVCERCSRIEECPYCAQKIYLNEDKEINRAVHILPTKENLKEILKTGPYGKCVYYCDNDIYDNVVSILRFKNNVTATLNITAFTDREDVNIRLMFSHGEMDVSLYDNTMRIKKFNNKNEEIIKFEEENLDYKLMENFINVIKNKNLKEIKSSIESSLESHRIAFAGEFANVSDTIVKVEDFYKEAVELTKAIENMMF